MEKHGENRRRAKLEATPSVRASISFPTDIYQILEELARLKKVSLAWVVRDAVERYVAEQDEQPKQE
jgi:metal-responsive CopG/Arc/MetJ family transcriptional regulator